MRFKLDENMPIDAATTLRADRHDVDTVVDERLGGALDANVIEACRREARVPVTLDLDFADIRRYPPTSHAGVWVLRPIRQSVREVVSLVRSAAALLESEAVAQRLWIVEPSRVRIRL